MFYMMFYLLLLSTLLFSCAATTNFLEVDTPRFCDQFAAETPSIPAHHLKVVTFNIAAAKKIDCAIEEMLTFEELRDADIPPLLRKKPFPANHAEMAQELRK